MSSWWIRRSAPDTASFFSGAFAAAQLAGAGGEAPAFLANMRAFLGAVAVDETEQRPVGVAVKRRQHGKRLEVRLPDSVRPGEVVSLELILPVRWKLSHMRQILVRDERIEWDNGGPLRGRRRIVSRRFQVTDPADPIDSTDPNDPMEPIDRADPTEPIDSTEPLHPMHNNESSDHSDHLESAIETSLG